jgi:hypothetical protein
MHNETVNAQQAVLEQMSPSGTSSVRRVQGWFKVEIRNIPSILNQPAATRDKTQNPGRVAKWLIQQLLP